MSVQRLSDNTQLQQVLAGSPSFLGVIIATTTKNNHDTATPFHNTGDALKGKVLMVQSDADCYIYPGSTNGATATGTATGNGVKLSAGERVVLTMTQLNGWLAAVSVSGTSNVKVWELL